MSDLCVIRKMKRKSGEGSKTDKIKKLRTSGQGYTTEKNKIIEPKLPPSNQVT